MTRTGLATVTFGDDLRDLLIVCGGLVALAVPELSFIFLAAVALWWIVTRAPSVSPPADDRQDLHDR